VQTQQPQDRRRQDLAGKLARLTYPVRTAVSRSEHPIGSLVCQAWGHRRTVQVPYSFRSAHARRAGQVEWECPRCKLRLGATTRES